MAVHRRIGLVDGLWRWRGSAGFFVWVEVALKPRGRDPLFDFSLMGFRSFRFGLITVSIVALGEFGVVFVLSIFLQTVLGFTALQTGFTFLPFAPMTLFVAYRGLLTIRFGTQMGGDHGDARRGGPIFALRHGSLAPVGPPIACPARWSTGWAWGWRSRSSPTSS